MNELLETDAQLPGEGRTSVSDLRTGQEILRSRCFHRSGAFVEFPRADLKTSIAVRFEKIVRAYPRRLAAKDGEQTLDYESLNCQINRIAHALVARFGDRNRPIAIMFDHGSP